MIRGVIDRATLLSLIPTQDSARHRVELLEKLWVARLWRRNQRIIEGTVAADRARFVLAWKIAREPRHQAGGLLGIRHQHLDDVLHGHCVVIRMPAIEVR